MIDMFEWLMLYKVIHPVSISIGNISSSVTVNDPAQKIKGVSLIKMKN